MTSVRKSTPIPPQGTGDAPQKRPLGPRCLCGSPITHTPGKRRRMYCSEACKKRAKRALAKIEREAANGAASQKGTRLGTEATEFPGPETATPDQGARTVARARKAQRYQGRRTLWKISGDKSCRGCGRNLMDPASGAVVAQTADGKSVVLGVMKCGKVWFCPVCSATIRQKRAEEITQAVVQWIAAGGTAFLVTLTARHDYKDELGDLMDAIQGSRSKSPAEIQAARRAVEEARTARDDARAAVKAAGRAASAAAPKGQKRAAAAAARAAAAPAEAEALRLLDAARAELAGTRRQAGAYQRLITGGTWAGRDDQPGIRDRIGYIGMIRATEVTVGEVNLWHPHIHAIVLVGGRLATTLDGETTLAGTFTPGAEALAEWEDHWRAVWTNHLQKTNPKYRPSDECSEPGCKCDGKGHGVDFKRLETAADAETFGEYIAKTQDGKSPALELARGDMKSGRKGNMTPFEMLYRIGDLMGGVPEDDEDAPGHGSLAWCILRWHEYERAMTGRRAIEWTRGLRQLLGIKGGDTEEDDKDMLAADETASEFRGGAAITEEGWTAGTRHALDFALTEAAEGTDANEDGGAALTARIREVLAVAGAEVHVRQLTATEVSDAYAAQLENLARRREEAALRRERERQQERRPHNLRLALLVLALDHASARENWTWAWATRRA